MIEIINIQIDQLIRFLCNSNLEKQSLQYVRVILSSANVHLFVLRWIVRPIFWILQYYSVYFE